MTEQLTERRFLEDILLPFIGDNFILFLICLGAIVVILIARKLLKIVKFFFIIGVLAVVIFVAVTSGGDTFGGLGGFSKLEDKVTQDNIIAGLLESKSSIKYTTDEKGNFAIQSSGIMIEGVKGQSTVRLHSMGKTVEIDVSKALNQLITDLEALEEIKEKTK